jgi:hypothetical protein
MKLIFILVIGLCTIYQNCAQSISFGAGPTFPIYYSPFEIGQYHSHSKGRLGYAFNLSYINPKGKQIGLSFEKISFIKFNRSDLPGPFVGNIVKSTHRTYFINFNFFPFQIDLIEIGRFHSLINFGFNLDLTLEAGAHLDCLDKLENGINNVNNKPGISIGSNIEARYKINERMSLFSAPIARLALIDKICDAELGPLNINYQFIFGFIHDLN